jgi:uncharacterized protein YukJ
MTSTILQSIPSFVLHPGRCFVCFKTTDSPTNVIYLAEINEKIKICTDLCLEKYRILDKDYKIKMAKQKENVKNDKKMIKPKPIKMGKAQAHLQSLSIKSFKMDDMKLEDIEDLEL